MASTSKDFTYLVPNETVCFDTFDEETLIQSQEENTEDSDIGFVFAEEQEASTVYVQDGQYVIPSTCQTILLQNDDGEYEQYVINNEGEMVLDETTLDTASPEYVQCTTEYGSSVIYCTGQMVEDGENEIEAEDSSSIMYDSDGTQLQIVSGDIVDNAPQLYKHLKLEAQNGEPEEIQEEELNDCIEQDDSSQQQQTYQYAILKDGKLHLQTFDDLDNTADNELETSQDGDRQQTPLQQQIAAFQETINLNANNSTSLQKITGKNLITGQTVTLGNYLTNIKQKNQNKNVNSILKSNIQTITKRRSYQRRVLPRSKPAVEKAVNIINKRFVMGNSSTGKRMVGKILQIKKPGCSFETIATSEVDVDKNCNRNTRTMLLTIKPSSNNESNTENAQVEDAVDDSFGYNVHMETSDDGENMIKDDEDHDDDLEDAQESVTNSMPVQEIHIDSNTGQVLTVKDDMTNPENQSKIQPVFLIKKHIISRDTLNYSISNTLSGLMSLETIQSQLENKNLMVKLVEKTYTHAKGGYLKSVFYIHGHMKQSSLQNNEQQWAFVPLIKENAAGTQIEEKCDKRRETTVEDAEQESKHLQVDKSKDPPEFLESVSLTLTVTTDRNGCKATKVSLHPKTLDLHCHVCTKEFKNLYHLRKHLKCQHSDDSTVTCDVCRKTFLNKAVLQKHRRLHTDGSLYQCSQCSKVFSSPASLKRHVTIHDPLLRNLQCTTCSLRFTDESSLSKHLLIHTSISEFACDLCSRTFITQAHLNSHRRGHIPVKQFCCPICGREFSRYSNLLRHLEIHRESGSLYKCDICGCSYSFSSSLTRHIVQSHISKDARPQA